MQFLVCRQYTVYRQCIQCTVCTHGAVCRQYTAYRLCMQCTVCKHGAMCAVSCMQTVLCV